MKPVRVDKASMPLKSCDENSNSTPHFHSTHTRVASAQETFCTVIKSIETSIFVPCTEPWNQSHILMDKKSIAAWTCQKCKFGFCFWFFFFLLLSIFHNIYGMFVLFCFVLNRTDQFWLTVTSHHKCLLFCFVLLLFFGVRMRICPSLKAHQCSFFLRTDMTSCELV